MMRRKGNSSKGIPPEKRLRNVFEHEIWAISYLFEECGMKSKHICDKCGDDMYFEKQTRLRCRNYKCRSSKSLWEGTAMGNSHIALNEFLRICYLWLAPTCVTAIQTITGHSTTTIDRIVDKIEEFIGEDIVSEKVGGPGIEVEIDESKFGKRKYHRGKHVEGVWVVGMVERTPERRIALVPVSSRDADIIATLILDNVHVRSIIITDGWLAYPSAIKLINANHNANFTHSIVNHSKNFVEKDGTHTNHVEGTWSGVKQNISARHMRINVINGKLIEFIWRRQNKGNLWKALIKALFIN